MIEFFEKRQYFWSEKIISPPLARTVIFKNNTHYIKYN